jgi:hypothetical protein
MYGAAKDTAARNEKDRRSFVKADVLEAMPKA